MKNKLNAADAPSKSLVSSITKMSRKDFSLNTKKIFLNICVFSFIQVFSDMSLEFPAVRVIINYGDNHSISIICPAQNEGKNSLNCLCTTVF